MDGQAPIGESRWPPIAAVATFMVLNVVVRLLIPGEGVIHVPWLMPVLEAGLLIALLMSNPTSEAERRRARRLAVTLVVLLVAVALWATGVLISDLVHGRGVSNSASDLLATAGVVWLGNNLTFSLLFWLLDAGGPIARAHHRAPVDFAFTQHLNPDLAPPGWQPRFFDYLHLGFTNSMAFSPTDVMPLTHRAKAAMVVQSTVSLALLGIVVARAVNAFT